MGGIAIQTQAGWKPYRNTTLGTHIDQTYYGRELMVSVDTLKLYTVAHGAKVLILAPYELLRPLTPSRRQI